MLYTVVKNMYEKTKTNVSRSAWRSVNGAIVRGVVRFTVKMSALRGKGHT